MIHNSSASEVAGYGQLGLNLW